MEEYDSQTQKLLVEQLETPIVADWCFQSPTKVEKDSKNR